MPSYCDIARIRPAHTDYHDTEYGFPESRETALFERLCLEICQAGLSWEIVLKRRPGLRAAFAEFEVDRVAAFDDADVQRLLANPAIIRNRLKVAAIIGNARRVHAMRKSDGGFDCWLKANHPREKADWLKLFKRRFLFCGGEIVGSFLISLGYLPGAHDPDCPVAARIAAIGAPWMAG